MKNKKANVLGIILIVGFIIAFLIGVGVGIFLLIPTPAQAIISITSNTYICPENHVCEAQPTFECTTLSGEEPNVIFRTDDSDYSRGWIAYDSGLGTLNPYSFSEIVSEISGIEDKRVSLAIGKDFFISSNGENLFVFKEDNEEEVCTRCVREGSVGDTGFPGCDFGQRLDERVIRGDCFGTTGIPRANEIKRCSICPLPQYYKYDLDLTLQINLGKGSDTNCIKETELCDGTFSGFNCLTKEVKLNREILYELSWNNENPTPEGGLLGQKVFMAENDILSYIGQINILKEEFQEERLTSCITSEGEIDIGDSVCTSETSLVRCVAGDVGENPSSEIENAVGRKVCIEPSPGNALIQCSESDCLFDGIGKTLDDKTGYYVCAEDAQGCGFIDFNNITDCPEGELFDEVELKCKPPYGFTFTLDKTNLGTNEFIVGNVVISAEERDQILIEVKILDADDRSEIISNQFLTVGGTRLFTFNPLPLGNYIIQGISKHPLGEQTKEVTIKVTSEVETSLGFPVGVDFTQFSNNPIVVRATAMDGSQLAQVTRWDIKTFINDREIFHDELDPLQGLSQVDIKTNVNEAGELRYEIFAVTTSGFETDTEIVRITVKKSNIIIPIDISSANNQETGSYTVSFQTLNNNNQLVNTDGNNDVTVTLPNTCKSGEFCTPKNKVIINPNIQGTNGQYSFIWNFEDSGLYVVEVASSATGFDISQATPTSVNIKAKNIVIGTDYTLWIVAGVLGILVFFIIGFIVVRIIKR